MIKQNFHNCRGDGGRKEHAEKSDGNLGLVHHKFLGDVTLKKLKIQVDQKKKEELSMYSNSLG